MHNDSRWPTYAIFALAVIIIVTWFGWQLWFGWLLRIDPPISLLVLKAGDEQMRAL